MAIVLLDKSQRGVGDIELRNSSAGRKWISGRDYVSSDDSNLPSGYVKYGVIYGFEKNGAAMLVAFDNAEYGGSSIPPWCTETNVTLPVTWTSHWGTALNGSSDSYTYKCMNVARVASFCKTRATNTTQTTHPKNARYDSSEGPNSEAVFLANTTAVNLYGTYEAYIAQTRPILKSTSAGVFSERCGKANTIALATDPNYTFSAAKACYNYVVSGSGDSAGNWWLPDMYELAVMMEDSHYDIHHTNSGVTTEVAYWSSVAYDASHAWYYLNFGSSSLDSFTTTWIRSRAVTISE